jgi:hypothetical protein
VPGGVQVFSTVFNKQKFGVAATMIALAFGLILGLTAQSQPAAAQEKKKQDWKNQMEYDMYDAFQKATTPQAKLAALEKWKQAFPDSDYAEDREEVGFLATYQQLMQWRQVIDTAQGILKTKPNDVPALTAILEAVQKIKPPTPGDLDLLEKTANYMWDNLDTIYAASNKPPAMKEDDWAKVKPQMKPYLVQALLWVVATRKDNVRAQTDLAALLKKDPTQAQVSYALGGAILAVAIANKKPDDQPMALYHFARAAAYDGPNSLPADNRKAVQTYLSKAYTTYHGSADGMDMLLAAAKNNPFPAGDFKILSTVDIATAKAKADAEAAAKDPMMTFWVKFLKEPILKDDAYFDMNVKDAALPGGANGVMKFKGKIVSMTPATRPKEIVLSVEKPGVGDAKLTLETALPGKMEAGEELQFEGVAKSYTKEPYMVTFETDAKQIDGWTGKNTPAAGAKKAPAAKK